MTDGSSGSTVLLRHLKEYFYWTMSTTAASDWRVIEKSEQPTHKGNLIAKDKLNRSTSKFSVSGERRDGSWWEKGGCWSLGVRWLCAHLQQEEGRKELKIEQEPTETSWNVHSDLIVQQYLHHCTFFGSKIITGTVIIRTYAQRIKQA